MISFLKKITLTLVVLTMICFIIVSILYFKLPAYLTESKDSSQAIVLVDRNGKEIRSYNPHETYDWIEIESVPKEYIDLFLLAEDQNFFHHNGIDLLGSIRSFYLNLKAQKIVSGASTITQQSYRLSHSLPRNFKGKLESILGALKIEQVYSKKKILEHYLNAVPLGKRVVGIKRASEVFFQKHYKNLSLAEIATLAVLPRAPTNLQSKKDRNKLLNLRNKLLKKYQQKFSVDQYQISIDLETPLELFQDYTAWDNYHFAMKVLKDLNFNHYVSEDGRVKTTLDIYLQEEVAQIIKSQIKHLEEYQVQNGAALVLDNETGDILAYVGNSDNSKLGGQFDALNEKRQVGSTLKPFTYALALNKGASLNKVLPDIPSYYKTGIGQFLPRNYDHEYSGPRLMREALSNSLNLPAVALVDELGVSELYNFLKNIGIQFDKTSDHYGVGLTLGNAEITPLNLLEAYTVFPRKGNRIKPKVFLDEKIETFATPMNSDDATLISHVLNDRTTRREAFGDRNVFDLPFTLSVKTGTSTDFRDNWAVGFNDQFSIIVWVGNMDQKPMKRVSGISGAGPILSNIANYISKSISIPKLSLSENIIEKQICSLSGKAPGKFCHHKKIELFKKTDGELEVCDYHQEYVLNDCHEEGDQIHTGLIQLPSPYLAFVADHPEWSIEGQVLNQCESGVASAKLIGKSHLIEKVAINRPLQDSFYAIDPNIPKEFQKLKVQLNQFTHIKKVIWEIDDKEKINGGPHLDWPLVRGKHKFRAEVIYNDGHKEKTENLNVTIL
jgi:penicillin-binding protein 1C